MWCGGLLSGVSLLLLLGMTLDMSALQEDASQEGHSKQELKAGRQRHQQTDVPKLDPEIQAVADMTALVPPEFAADALLRLARSDRINQRPAKVELITKAFYLAESALQPVKKRPGIFPFPTDSRIGFLSSAFDLKLDRLSLQSRAVADMLDLDRAKARALFNQIKVPSLIPVGCDQPLAYDLRPFYETLDKLIRIGFTEKEKLEGRREQVLERYIADLHSHSQVGPVAELLTSSDLPPAELKVALTSFASSLATLRQDKRSFTSAAMYHDFDSLSKLLTVLDAKGVQVVPTLPTFREYLVSNFQGAPCAEILNAATNGKIWAETKAKSLSDAAQYFVHRFNEGLGPTLSNYAIAPIGASEIQEDLDSSQPSNPVYWESPESKELLEENKALRFGKTGELTVEERSTFSWNLQLEDFLRGFESWDPGHEPPDNLFCEKAEIYTSLIQLVPGGPERFKIIQSDADFFAQSDFRLHNRIEWFWQLYLLFAELRIRHSGAQPEVIQIFENSRDPILSLYAHLERLVPGPTDRMY